MRSVARSVRTMAWVCGGGDWALIADAFAFKKALLDHHPRPILVILAHKDVSGAWL